MYSTENIYIFYKNYYLFNYLFMYLSLSKGRQQIFGFCASQQPSKHTTNVVDELSF